MCNFKVQEALLPSGFFVLPVYSTPHLLKGRLEATIRSDGSLQRRQIPPLQSDAILHFKQNEKGQECIIHNIL